MITWSSNSKAAVTASPSAAASAALATPMEEPRLAGLTKSGSPRAATASSRTSRDQVWRCGDAPRRDAGGRGRAGPTWRCPCPCRWPRRGRRRRRRGRRAPRGGPGSRRPRRRGRAAPGRRRRRRAGRRRGRGAARGGTSTRRSSGEASVSSPSAMSTRTAPASTHRLSWVRPMAVHRPAAIRAPSARSGAPRRTTPRARPTGPRRSPPAPGVQASTEAIHSPAEDDACASRHLSSRRISAERSSGPTSRSTARASTRGRSLAGQLFVPIVAERDGHAFIAAALEAGAPAYLTSREPVGGDGHRGGRHRGRADATWADRGAGRASGAAVIGITGSVGQDDDQGPGAPLPGVDLPRPRRASGPSTTSSACRSRCSTRPTTRAGWCSRWGRGGSATSPSWRRSPGPRSASSPAWPWRTSSTSATSTGWRGPRASWWRRCRPRAWPCSTSTTSAWPPCASVSRCPVVGYAVAGRRRRRCAPRR